MKYAGTLIHIIPTDYLKAHTEKEYCPMTEAIRRALPQAKQIAPSFNHVYIDGISYEFPSVAIGIMNDLYRKYRPAGLIEVQFKLGKSTY